jgi:hypothetical protein
VEDSLSPFKLEEAAEDKSKMNFAAYKNPKHDLPRRS